MKQNELFNKCCENIDPKTREEVWKQMDKELGREENRGNSPKIPLSEFEKNLERKIKCYTGIVQTKNAAKQWAKELMSLAKKELYKDFPKWKKQTSEQRECIWDIPEDKRHCEFCTANCNKVPTISTTTAQELEQSAKAKKTVRRMFKKLGLDGEYIYNPTARLVARNAFRAGAEWQQKQKPVDLEKILELVEKPLELFTERNLDKRKGYTNHDMQDAFILGFKAGIEKGGSK